jgi:hypothetical protein
MNKRTCFSSVPNHQRSREKNAAVTCHGLGEGKIQVALTAGACLLALLIVLKNILYIPADRFMSEFIVYIIIYTGICLAYPLLFTEGQPQIFNYRAIWSAFIVAMTLVIIVVSAV